MAADLTAFNGGTLLINSITSNNGFIFNEPLLERRLYRPSPSQWILQSFVDDTSTWAALQRVSWLWNPDAEQQHLIVVFRYQRRWDGQLAGSMVDRDRNTTGAWIGIQVSGLTSLACCLLERRRTACSGSLRPQPQHL